MENPATRFDPAGPERPAKRPWAWLALALALPALVSLGYGIATAGARSFDLRLFRRLGAVWWRDSASISPKLFPGYPPYALVAFWPLNAIPAEALPWVWLVVNVAACGAVVWLVRMIWGRGWSRSAVLFLAAYFAVWAPVRVTLRTGQISLVILALILGAEVVRRSGRQVPAGLLLGAALVKPSLAGPFLLYWAWRREWRMVGTALAVVTGLTAAYCIHTGVWPWVAMSGYLSKGVRVWSGKHGYFEGTTDIRPLMETLCGGSDWWGWVAAVALAAAALAAMFWLFRHRKEEENTHLAVLALFSLWAVYHRVYDSVAALPAAALFVADLEAERRVRLAAAGLAALGLLAVSLPGLLTERLGLTAGQLDSPWGFLGLHADRLVVFGLFLALLITLRRERRETVADHSLEKTNSRR